MPCRGTKNLNQPDFSTISHNMLQSAGSFAVKECGISAMTLAPDARCLSTAILGNLRGASDQYYVHLGSRHPLVAFPSSSCFPWGDLFCTHDETSTRPSI